MYEGTAFESDRVFEYKYSYSYSNTKNFINNNEGLGFEIEQLNEHIKSSASIRYKYEYGVLEYKVFIRSARTWYLKKTQFVRWWTVRRERTPSI